MGKRKIKLDDLKISEVLTLGLRDLKKVEMDKRYVVDMDDWHSPMSERWKGGKWVKQKTCSVCFAGSVMAKTLGAKPTMDREIEDFPGSENALIFLDRIRSGQFRFDANDSDESDRYDIFSITSQYDEQMHEWLVEKGDAIKITCMHFQHDVPDYANDKRGFKRSIGTLIKKLQALGL